MYRAKLKLKGSKIAIIEHLTRRRYKLFKLAKEGFGVRNVWTLDGKIFTNKGVEAEGRQYLIKSESNLTSEMCQKAFFVFTLLNI